VSLSSPRHPRHIAPANEARLAAIFVAPAVGIVLLVAAFPVLWTIWESFHRHDLRLPWLGRPFIGLANYREALSDARAWSALLHTVAFTAVTVAIELGLGLALAFALRRSRPGIGLMRAGALVPWAIPTVVAALIWRFVFDTPGGVVNALIVKTGFVDAAPAWFSSPWLAWLPIVVADVWRNTPFMALLLLAGLQGIDPFVYEAAALDGAGALRQTFHVTLPLLRPAIFAAVIFRCLDAFRVFDVIYVMTGGGPGTATEPLSLLAFGALFRGLRFGYGAALSVMTFLVSFLFALLWLRLTQWRVEQE
jgi:ABC-type sugar transport system permease subunit